METATLTVPKYRDAQGQPTCAKNFVTREVCRFHGFAVMGTVDVCLICPTDRIERRGDGTGTTVPHANCPLWHGA